MEILGIGMPELVFIIVIALIVLGPKDMQKAGRTIGRFLRNVVTSDGWKTFMQTSREIRTLPNRLMREANDEINKLGNEISASDPTRTYNSIGNPTRSRPNPSQPSGSDALPADKKNPASHNLDDDSSIDDPEKNA